MSTSKGLYFWFGIFAFCFLSYQQITDNIRPHYGGGNETIKYLLGIAPNFFPAIGIPALLIILLPQLHKSSKWFNSKRYITANLISATGLICWEIIQATSTRLHFDLHDIIWTIAGAIIFQIIWIITPVRFK